MPETQDGGWVLVDDEVPDYGGVSVIKYDENEPRDQQGQWTDGGSSDTARPEEKYAEKFAASTEFRVRAFRQYDASGVHVKAEGWRIRGRINDKWKLIATVATEDEANGAVSRHLRSIEKIDTSVRKDATARQLIESIADEAVPAMRDEILETLAHAQGQGTLAAVEAALERGDVEGAIDAIGWDTIAADQLLDLLPGHYVEIINAAARVASDAAAFDVSFTAVDEAAAQWALEQAAARVTGISEATRAGLRSLISLGQTAGIPPRELAKLIREQVGLTEQGAQSLFNYRVGLEESGRSAGDIERLVARQGERLLNQRALLIARTETLSAGSAGQQLSWEQAADEGNIPETAERRWSTARDERACPACRAMHGKVVGLREPWVVPDGREIMIPQDLHPG